MIGFLAFLLWYPWLWMTIFFHELGHFIIGRSLGLAPYALVVGKGPVLFSKTGRSAAVYLRLYPRYGMVFAPTRDTELPTWKYVLFYGAGLAVDSVVLFLLILVIFKGGLDADVGQVLTLLAIGHVIIMALNLVPRTVNLGGMLTANDGKLIWNLLRGGKVDTRTRDRTAYAAAVQRYDPGFNADHAWFTGADTALTQLFIRGMLAAEAGDTQLALAMLDELLERVRMEPAEEAMVLDQMACAALLRGKGELAHRALDLATRARALVPNCLTVQGTLGAAMIESGKESLRAADAAARTLAKARIREGIALLLPLTAEGNPPSDQSTAARYLAKGHELLGEREETARWKKRSLAGKASAAPWANQKVGVIARIGAAFIVLCVALPYVFAGKVMFKGLLEINSWQEAVFALFAVTVMPYMAVLCACIVVRGRAPSGWVPWK